MACGASVSDRGDVLVQVLQGQVRPLHLLLSDGLGGAAVVLLGLRKLILQRHSGQAGRSDLLRSGSFRKPMEVSFNLTGGVGEQGREEAEGEPVRWSRPKYSNKKGAWPRKASSQGPAPQSLPSAFPGSTAEPRGRHSSKRCRHPEWQRPPARPNACPGADFSTLKSMLNEKPQGPRQRQLFCVS